MKVLAVFFIAFLQVAGWSVSAQTMIRESVSSLGSSSQVGDISISQTVGQPYGTINNSSETTLLRQGFQQPVEYSLEPIRMDFSILVFPNPATYQVNLKWENEMDEASVRVSDMNGKIIRDFKIFNARECSLECTGWASGLYIISLSNKDLGTYSTKLTILN